MEQHTQLWQLIAERLATELTPLCMKTWFDDIQILSYTPDTLTLLTNSFKKPHITERYIPNLQRVLADLFGGECNVIVLDDPDALTKEDALVVQTGQITDHYTFDNFVVGKSNEFAHAAAMAVTVSSAAENNPLFLYGNSGLGKTHLLYAIMNKVKKENNQLRLCAVTAEQFTNELITSFRVGNTKDFRDRYRMVDMLFIDDIQFIGGKDSTMEEFFNTFNELYMANHHLVFTSDRPPREIPALTERLRGRFESGLVVDIQPPDFETRVAILQKKAFTLGYDLPDSICYYIAENITANIRQLEGAVKKITAYHELLKQPLSLETAQRAISDLLSENPGLNPTSDHIIQEVSKFYGVEIEELLGSSKRANIVLARQVAIYLVHQLLDLTLQQIGAIFNRDHSTINHSLNKIDGYKATGDDVVKEINTIIRNIRG